jgi:hypothetical protein
MQGKAEAQVQNSDPFCPYYDGLINQGAYGKK